MSTKRAIAGLLAGTMVALCASARDANYQDEQLLELKPSGQVTVKALVMVPDRPRALAVLFAGDRGLMELSGSRGLVTMNQLGLFDLLPRARNHFFKRDVALIVIDAINGQAMSPDDRERSATAAAALLDQVHQQLRLPASLPLWIIGNREGSISAAALALQQHPGVSGLILLSAVTRPGEQFGDWATRRSQGLASLDWSRFDKPVLVLANQDDRCPFSPPADAAALVARFSASPRREVQLMTGDNPVGDACGRVSPHNYFAVVEPTAAAIVAFIVR